MWGQGAVSARVTPGCQAAGASPRIYSAGPGTRGQQGRQGRLQGGREQRDLLLPKTLLATPPQVAGAERLIWRQGSTDCLGKVTFDRCQVQTRSSQYSHPPSACLQPLRKGMCGEGGGSTGGSGAPCDLLGGEIPSCPHPEVPAP